MHSSLRASGVVFALAVLSLDCVATQSTSAGQLPPRDVLPKPRDPALEFLYPYGLENFSRHHVDALQAFVKAQARYYEEDYVGAQQVLDNLWSRYPTGGVNWGNLPNQPFGINIGSPPCYYSLRMLSDMADWRVASGVTGTSAPRSVRMTVILVGESEGTEPQNLQDLQQGTGIPVVHTLHPEIEADGHRVVHQSLRLFREYVYAITEGNLDVETHILSLPSVRMAVHAYVIGGSLYYAGLENAADVWASVPANEQLATDWWWILYPSHVPEQYPDFTNTEFITGGMGTGPDQASPFFIIDDRWLVRKPPHIGTGPYSDIERRAYLPQWLQHEFYHHLFRTWPEFGLEDSPHQWFNLGNWPPDFEGRYEADYYHEALTKRLQTAEPPPHVALRYATADAPWNELVQADVLGTFVRSPVQNPWHIGTISTAGGGQLEWTNNANVSWGLAPDLANGVLLTGPDCPYYDPPSGTKFDIALVRDAIGDLTSEVEGFRFNGELYEKQ